MTPEKKNEFQDDGRSVPQGENWGKIRSGAGKRCGKKEA
jgi:hypothetical protein